MSEFAMQVSDRVEKMRLKKGWTKRELAKRAALNEVHVYKICAGKRPQITAETVAHLADAFDTTTDYLLGRSHDDMLS